MPSPEDSSHTPEESTPKGSSSEQGAPRSPDAGGVEESVLRGFRVKLATAENKLGSVERYLKLNRVERAEKLLQDLIDDIIPTQMAEVEVLRDSLVASSDELDELYAHLNRLYERCFEIMDGMGAESSEDRIESEGVVDTPQTSETPAQSHKVRGLSERLSLLYEVIGYIGDEDISSQEASDRLGFEEADSWIDLATQIRDELESVESEFERLVASQNISNAAQFISDGETRIKALTKQLASRVLEVVKESLEKLEKEVSEVGAEENVTQNAKDRRRIIGEEVEQFTTSRSSLLGAVLSDFNSAFNSVFEQFDRAVGKMEFEQWRRTTDFTNTIFDESGGGRLSKLAARLNKLVDTIQSRSTLVRDIAELEKVRDDLRDTIRQAKSFVLGYVEGDHNNYFTTFVDDSLGEVKSLLNRVVELIGEKANQLSESKDKRERLRAEMAIITTNLAEIEDDAMAPHVQQEWVRDTVRDPKIWNKLRDLATTKEELDTVAVFESEVKNRARVAQAFNVMRPAMLGITGSDNRGKTKFEDMKLGTVGEQADIEQFYGVMFAPQLNSIDSRESGGIREREVHLAANQFEMTKITTSVVGDVVRRVLSAMSKRKPLAISKKDGKTVYLSAANINYYLNQTKAAIEGEAEFRGCDSKAISIGVEFAFNHLMVQAWADPTSTPRISSEPYMIFSMAEYMRRYVRKSNYLGSPDLPPLMFNRRSYDGRTSLESKPNQEFRKNMRALIRRLKFNDYSWVADGLVNLPVERGAGNVNEVVEYNDRLYYEWTRPFPTLLDFMSVDGINASDYTFVDPNHPELGEQIYIEGVLEHLRNNGETSVIAEYFKTVQSDIGNFVLNVLYADPVTILKKLQGEDYPKEFVKNLGYCWSHFAPCRGQDAPEIARHIRRFRVFYIGLAARYALMKRAIGREELREILVNLMEQSVNTEVIIGEAKIELESERFLEKRDFEFVTKCMMTPSIAELMEQATKYLRDTIMAAGKG